MRALLELHNRRRPASKLPHRLPPLRRSPRHHRLPTLRCNQRLTTCNSQPRTQGMSQTTMPETDNLQLTTYNLPDRRPWLLLLSALVILLDRLSKNAIIHRIRPGYDIPIIPGVFRLSHVLNTGAAFSLLENWPPNAVRLGLI